MGGVFFFFQAEDGIRDVAVTGVQTCALPIYGRDLFQALRAKGVQAPVVFLTARDALVDRIAGFDAGGDDYVAKPFALAEVIARIHALLRRAGVSDGVEAAGLRLDPSTHAVASTAGEVPLTPTEFRLLAQ